MKKVASVLIICLVSAVAMGQAVRYDTIRYARKYYAKRVALFEAEPVVKGRIVLLGNSITEFGDWKRLLNDTTVINRGIAADNTFGVLDRLDDVIRREPRKLFIEIGINDLSQDIPIPIIVKNILDIVKKVKDRSPKTEIYVHGILPTNDNVKNEYPDAFNKNGLADQVNGQLKQSARSNKYIYVDLSAKLKDKDGKLNTLYGMPDGIHLNEAGYHVWIDLLKGKGYL